MRKVKLITILVLTCFVLSNCGFKVVDKSILNNFDIAEINTSGEKRINYILKNKIQFSSNKNEKNLISIDLLTKKNKKSKERNIKNEITKFEIKIEVKTTIKNINNSNIVDFKVIQIGEYNVNKQYSQTLDNEKKLIELLTDKLADEILDQISVRLNAI